VRQLWWPLIFKRGAKSWLIFLGGNFDFAAPGRPVYDLAQFARMCVPTTSTSALSCLDGTSPTAPLDSGASPTLTSSLPRLLTISSTSKDHSMNRGADFVRRRVATGDPSFIRMLEQMGGPERFERRRRWWESRRTEFVAALA
jgi:hypothetical protein